MRLIDADALIECIKDDLYNSYKDDQWYRLIADALIDTIAAQPTIEIKTDTGWTRKKMLDKINHK